MTPARSAKLFELETIRRLLLVLGRDVIPVFALGALQRDIVSCHSSPIPVSDKLQFVELSYSITSDTVPAPTVRPPSRIANRSPFSIAIGAIRSIVNCELSPC